MIIRDKALREDLERCAKEVEGWPAWKRSIDLRDLKKMNRGEPSK
jgi:hypothetical protein